MNEKQFKFTKMVAQLLQFAFQQPGYEIRIASAYRKGDPRLHGQYLAIDLDLFIDGEYQASTEAHRVLGEYWESIGGSWGGRFDDGNHYSLAHGGMR